MLTARLALPAFTLVELLVVIAIIVLLATFMLPVLSYAIRQARRGACELLINNVTQAIEMYRSELGQPPESRIGREPQATGYWAVDQNIRYNDLMGAEILTEALVGHDNAIINRPASNPPPGTNPNDTYRMHANLAMGLGIRNAATLALQPRADGTYQTVNASDGTVQLNGQVYGPYFQVDKLLSTSLALDPDGLTTGKAFMGAKPANYPSSPCPDTPPNPPRRVIADPFGGALIYYKAQRPRFTNAAWRQTLCEPSGSPSSMTTDRDTGVNRNSSTLPLFLSTQNFTASENGQTITYVRAPIFDLDHNADILGGKNPVTGISYKPAWGTGWSTTEYLRRWLKGWNSTGTPAENEFDKDFVQVDPDALRVQDYLIVSSGPDGMFGRAQQTDKTADDLTNVPRGKQ